MHPQIRSPEPGVCPICHMNLEPIPDERRNQSASAASTSVVESAAFGDRLRVRAPGFV